MERENCPLCSNVVRKREESARNCFLPSNVWKMEGLDPINFPYLTPADWALFRTVVSTSFGVGPRRVDSVLFGRYSTALLRLRLERFSRMVLDLTQRNLPTGRLGFLVASLVLELASRGDYNMDMRVDDQYVICELSFSKVL